MNAYLLIIIYIVILFYIFSKTLKPKLTYIMEETRKNNKNNAVGGALGAVSGRKGNGFVHSLTKKIFAPIKKIFMGIFAIFANIFKKFGLDLNNMRGIMVPMQDFFKTVTMHTMKKAKNIFVGLGYMLHKMRETLRRSLSNFNMVFHTLRHTQYMLGSFMNGPIPGMAKFGAKVLDGVSGLYDSLGGGGGQRFWPVDKDIESIRNVNKNIYRDELKEKSKEALQQMMVENKLLVPT